MGRGQQAKEESNPKQELVSQGRLRRPVVCPMHTRRGTGQEDDKDGGVEQPGPDNQVQSGGEEGGDPGGEIEEIEPMGWREVWPAKLFSLPD